jgi:hypothetical protein
MFSTWLRAGQRLSHRAEKDVTQAADFNMRETYPWRILPFSVTFRMFVLETCVNTQAKIRCYIKAL